LRYIVNTQNTNLNVRAKPSTSAAIVSTLPKGTVVEVSATQSGFGKVRAGWASLSYLTPVSSETSPVGPATPAYAPLPNLEKMWTNFPRDHDPEAVKRAIGGAVNASWIKNTCAVRLSRAFNLSGHPIPSNFPGLKTVKGADGLNYAFRVAEMANYLEKTFGPARYHVAGGAESKKKFAGKKGIVWYDVPGWSDATGHLDMWNGRSPAYAEYFGLARTVTMWK
jgi:hypothetical protein